MHSVCLVSTRAPRILKNPTIPWTPCPGDPGDPGDPPRGWAHLCAALPALGSAGHYEWGTLVQWDLPAAAEESSVHAASE